MLKSITVVVGSYLLSVVLVLATDPLLSRLFPRDFVKARVPSETALIARTALFVVRLDPLCLALRPLCSGPRRASCALVLIVGEAMGIGAIIPNWSKGWPHWYWLLSWLLNWPVSSWIGLLLAGRRADPPPA
jgi:hypothetical protein